MKEVTAYICDFCPRKKRFAQRGTALRHEGRCFYNPVRRACATCEHFSMERAYYEHETQYSEAGGPVCALGILPIDMGPENPPKTMTSECDKWEPKVRTEFPAQPSPETVSTGVGGSQETDSV